MQDLIDKIEELKKALTSFKPKSQQNSLVPALSAPTVKPLSMPSVKASAPAKLPGVTTPSGKDPKAMAAQLKNPRPKKPKIEVMKADEGGVDDMHRIHVDGHPVTEPMSLKDLTSKHGSVKHIESHPGHKIVPMKLASPQVKLTKMGQWTTI